MKATNSICVAALAGESPTERAQLLQHLLREIAGSTVHQITFEINNPRFDSHTRKKRYIVTVIYE